MSFTDNAEDRETVVYYVHEHSRHCKGRRRIGFFSKIKRAKVILPAVSSGEDAEAENSGEVLEKIDFK